MCWNRRERSGASQRRASAACRNVVVTEQFKRNRVILRHGNRADDGALHSVPVRGMPCTEMPFLRVLTWVFSTLGRFLSYF
jgi:hypothetical protein